MLACYIQGKMHNMEYNDDPIGILVQCGENGNGKGDRSHMIQVNAGSRMSLKWYQTRYWNARR